MICNLYPNQSLSCGQTFLFADIIDNITFIQSFSALTSSFSVFIPLAVC